MKGTHRYAPRAVAWALAVAAAFAPARRTVAEESAGTPPKAEAPPAPGGGELVEEIEVKGKRPTRSSSLEVREVRETAARDVGEALDGLADLAKVRKAGIANDVVLRGMKKDDVAVLIDGQQLHGGCPSRMDPPAFHLDYAEVDRIEVKKGPFDVTHPGGIGGLVDVRTRGTRRAGFGTEVNLSAGSAGTRETSGVLAYEVERADVLAGAAYKAGDPYVSGDGRNFTLAVPDRNPSTGLPNPARFRDRSATQTAYDVRSGWGKAGFAPAEGHRVDLSYTRQSSVDVLYPYLSMDGTADDTDRLSLQYAIAGTGLLRKAAAQTYWNRVQHDMNDATRCSSAADVASCTGSLPRSYSMSTAARTVTFGGKIQADLEGGWLAGADFASRTWDNTTTRVARSMPGQPYRDDASIPDVTIDGAGGFAQARRPLGERFALIVGARVDVQRAKAGIDRSAVYTAYRPGQDLRLSRADLLLSGNLQLEWTVVPSSLLFLGFGHGTRMPDPQELYMALSPMMQGAVAWVGNPGLRPTQNDEVDAGAKYTSGGVLLKAQLFHAWVTDYVSLANIGSTASPAKTYANVSARLYGGEASAKLSLPLRLFAGLGVAYTRGLNDSTGGNLAEIPPLKGIASLRWDAGWLFAEVEEVVAAPQPKVDAALGESETGGWAITNLRLGTAWRGVKVFAGVRNLLDRFYTEHLSYLRDPFASGVKVPEPGRTLYLNAQYQL
jgi:iron complex outermembrane receptor protein